MSFDKPSSQQEIFKVNFKLKINIKRDIEWIKVNRMPIILLKVMERGGIVCNLISPIYLGVPTGFVKNGHSWTTVFPDVITGNSAERIQ